MGLFCGGGLSDLFPHPHPLAGGLSPTAEQERLINGFLAMGRVPPEVLAIIESDQQNSSRRLAAMQASFALGSPKPRH